MSGPLQDELYLILKILPKLTVDTVCKGLVVSEIYPKDTLKFRPSNWNFVCGAMFILMPSLEHCTTQKQGSKKDAFEPLGFGNVKVFFTPLTKVIAV